VSGVDFRDRVSNHPESLGMPEGLICSMLKLCVTSKYIQILRRKKARSKQEWSRRLLQFYHQLLGAGVAGRV